MVENQEKKMQRKIKEIEVNADILRRVKEHGGPCVTDGDVDRLKEMFIREGRKKVTDVFKDELRYQKSIKRATRLTLKGTLEDLVDRLKVHLQSNSV